MAAGLASPGLCSEPHPCPKPVGLVCFSPCVQPARALCCTDEWEFRGTGRAVWEAVKWLL